TDCSELFEEYLSFGDNAQCRFTSDHELEIQLGENHSIFVGMNITLKNQTIEARDPVTQCSDYIDGSYLIEAPKERVIPVANLITPNRISSCQDLVLDASYSYGYGNLKFLWNLVSENNSELQQFLQNLPYNSSKITIPHNLLPDGTLIFEVKILDNIGLIDVKQIQVEKQVNEFIPIVKLLGPEMITIHRGDALLIETHARFPDCISIEGKS